MTDNVNDILNISQINRVILFYEKHKDWVDNLIKNTEKEYPPSQPEDKYDPSIWKGEYWKWFFNYKT